MGSDSAQLLREAISLTRHIEDYGKRVAERVGKDKVDDLTEEEWIEALRYYQTEWEKSVLRDLLNTIHQMGWLFAEVSKGQSNE